MGKQKREKTDVPMNVRPRGWRDEPYVVLPDDDRSFLSPLLESDEVPKISLFDQRGETQDDD